MIALLIVAAGVLDLTYPFDAKTLYWPTGGGHFELRQLHSGKTAAGYFYAANAFCAPEHGGTHIDAPLHFAEGKLAVDQIPPQRLFGPAVVVDATAQAARDRDYRVTAADISAEEKARGPIPRGAIVILRTGWAKRWPDRKAYFGDDRPGDASNLHFPGLAEDGARLLVERPAARRDRLRAADEDRRRLGRARARARAPSLAPMPVSRRGLLFLAARAIAQPSNST